MGWASPEAREVFQKLMKQEAERRNRSRQTVSEALQSVPATQDTLDELSALSPGDAERALRTHPGYLAQRKIESVGTMLELFRRALADLAAAIADFPELGEPNGRIYREELEKDVSVRVNKELFAVLGAAQTLVDYSRSLKDLIGKDLYDAKRKHTFPPGEHELVVGLRNSVVHQVHSQANWQRRWHEGTKTTHFVIQPEDLLAEGKLTSAAREHLPRLGPICDVTDLLQGYSERVDRFYAWFLPQVESRLPLEVSDYRACRKAVKRQHGRMRYAAVIGLWTQTGVDPYDHLPKHLTSDQLKEMGTLPHRSPQQIDYIISCLDQDEVCDDHLRAIVYKFFKVSASGEEAANQGEDAP